MSSGDTSVKEESNGAVGKDKLAVSGGGNDMSTRGDKFKDALNQSRLSKPTTASKARTRQSMLPPPKRALPTGVKSTRTVPVRPVTAAKTSRPPVGATPLPSRPTVGSTPLPVSKKGATCSTPEGEDCPADMTVDVSCISHNSLDQSVFTRSVARGSSRGSKITGGVVEEEFNEEMLEVAYTRYIQACFIAMKSREAKEEVKKEVDNQIFTAFSATEKLRKEAAAMKEEKKCWECLAKVGRVLKLVKEKLAPALELMAGADGKLARMVEGLDKVQHHLIVQGITLPDQEVAAKELESMSTLFAQFYEEFEPLEGELRKRAPQIKCLAAEYEQVASQYSYCLELVKRARRLLRQVDSLKTQEASLAISFDQLRKEERKMNAG